MTTARGACSGRRVRMYYRDSHGTVCKVQGARRVGANVELTLEDGRRFLTDPRTPVYTSRKAAENARRA